MSDDLAIRAEFNALIRPYLVLYVAMVLCMTVIFIPLALIWVMGLGQWWAKHYFDKLECELSPETLRFRKGIIFQVEKTIPLENIQDVTFIEGPLLRSFHLSVLKFETAGQTAGQAHDMKLIGIIDADQFRQKILQARAQIRRRQAGESSPSGSDTDLLRAIDGKLQTVIDLLRKPG